MGSGRMAKRNRRRGMAAKIHIRNRLQQMEVFEKIGYEPKEYYVIYHRNG